MNLFHILTNTYYLCLTRNYKSMNKICYVIIGLLTLTSCANTFNIAGTTSVSTLDGQKLYLKVLKDSMMKNLDSCDVVHGQFQFAGSIDSVRVANIIFDNSGSIPVVLEDGSIQVKIDNTQETVSGTPLNDKGETKAVKLAFGEHSKELLISSTKSMTGHLLGASGAIEAVMAIKALEDQFAPPTVGYKVPDEECDLKICPNEGVAFDSEYAMSNSLGFGGHNASLIFKRV